MKKEDAIDLVNMLEQDEDVLDYYKKSNNSPSSAFHKYLEFLNSLKMLKEDYLVGAVEVSNKDEVPLYNEKISVWVNRYERDAKKRQECINDKGLCCYVCGMNFEEVYGEIGRDFIHVHHIKPLADNGQDISENLIPVCPNCHAMLHRYLKEDSRDYIAFKKEMQKLKK